MDSLPQHLEKVKRAENLAPHRASSVSLLIYCPTVPAPETRLPRPEVPEKWRVLGDLLRRGFEREVPGLELPTDGVLWRQILAIRHRCQYRTLFVRLDSPEAFRTSGIYLKEHLAHGGYRLTFRGELYCPWCAAQHLNMLRQRLLRRWERPLYLQLDCQNLKRLEKARERSGMPLYRWFRTDQGITAFTTGKLGKRWSDIPIAPGSLEGILDTVLLGMMLEVPALSEKWQRFRNRPTDGSPEWSKEAYLNEFYRSGKRRKGKLLGTANAPIQAVIAKAESMGIHVSRRVGLPGTFERPAGAGSPEGGDDSDESTGRSAFAESDSASLDDLWRHFARNRD